MSSQLLLPVFLSTKYSAFNYFYFEFVLYFQVFQLPPFILFTGLQWLCQVEGKEKGQEEGGWIWREKTWKGLGIRRETKSIGTNRKYFRAVATPKKENPKEEDVIKSKRSLKADSCVLKNTRNISMKIIKSYSS